MATKKRVTKKNLKVVEPDESVSKTAPAEEPLSPKGHIEQALALVRTCLERLELGSYSLEDGKAYFKDIPQERQTELIKAINNFLQKAHFNLTSLRDEIMIALNQAPAKAETLKFVPTITIEVPAIPTAAVLAEKATLDDLKKAKECVAIGLNLMATANIQAFEAQRILPALTFFTSLHQDLAARCDGSKGEAA